jgi:hypothetical protein
LLPRVPGCKRGSDIGEGDIMEVRVYSICARFIGIKKIVGHPLLTPKLPT